MKTLLNKAWITMDEESSPENNIAMEVEKELKKVKMDTYNDQYIVHITVHKVSDRKVN